MLPIWPCAGRCWLLDGFHVALRRFPRVANAWHDERTGIQRASQDYSGGPKAGVSNDAVCARKLSCGTWELDLNADKEFL